MRERIYEVLIIILVLILISFVFGGCTYKPPIIDIRDEPMINLTGWVIDMETEK